MAKLSFPAYPKPHDLGMESVRRFFKTFSKLHKVKPYRLHDEVWKDIILKLQARIPPQEQWEARIYCTDLDAKPEYYWTTVVVRTDGKGQRGKFVCPLDGVICQQWEELGEIPPPTALFVMYAPPDAPVTDLDV